MLPCDCQTTTNLRGKVVIVVRWPLDNQRNWRFRNELGSQIAHFCELFPTEDLAELTHNQSEIFSTEASTKVLAAMKVKTCNAFWKC